MDGPTWKNIRKKLVSKHSNCGIETFRCVKSSKRGERRVFTGNDEESLSLKDRERIIWKRKVEDETFVKRTE
jgi:hypothetical protein